VDPPISDAFVQGVQSTEKLQELTLQTRLFQGGFQDVCHSLAFPEKTLSTSGPSPSSARENLIWYWSHVQPLQSDAKGLPLFLIAYHPLRMVAGEWMIYLELMFHSVKQYEYSPVTIPAALEQITTLHTDIHSIQRWLRRCMASTQKIRDVLYFLRHRCSVHDDQQRCAPLIEDYKQIASSIDAYSHRLESMISIATSLVQTIDCRRSLNETKNISRLTYLALVFIPLTFVSGLFSMHESIAPGGYRFWVYFSVAIPLCAIVCLVTWLPSVFLWTSTSFKRVSMLNTKSFVSVA